MVEVCPVFLRKRPERTVGKYTRAKYVLQLVCLTIHIFS
jgi:hypothetical protein